MDVGCSFRSINVDDRFYSKAGYNNRREESNDTFRDNIKSTGI